MPVESKRDKSKGNTRRTLMGSYFFLTILSMAMKIQVDISGGTTPQALVDLGVRYGHNPSEDAKSFGHAVNYIFEDLDDGVAFFSELYPIKSAPPGKGEGRVVKITVE